jgi:hypothetical protein
VAKKKTRRSRVSRVEILAMHGEKPSFANLDDLSEDEQKKAYSYALSWYHDVYSFKESKEFFEDFVKKTRKKSDLAAVKSAAWISPTWGNVAQILEDGYKSDELLVRLNAKVDELIKEGAPVLAEKKKVAKVKNNFPVLSIQERVANQARELLGEVDFEIDEFVEGKCKKTDFDLYKFLQVKEVKGPHTKLIRDDLEIVLVELKELVDGKDDQLNEGYSFLSKSQQKKYCEFIQGMVDDAEAWGNVRKSTRKPRARKIRSVEQRVAKVKYKVRDDSFKIVSVSPDRMIESNQIWIFNTKDRFLYKYNSERGMTIKGTTLQDFDEATSFKKKIRKPDSILPKVLNNGKVKLRKLMDTIAAKETKVTGRISKDMIILRVI